MMRGLTRGAALLALALLGAGLRDSIADPGSEFEAAKPPDLNGVLGQWRKATDTRGGTAPGPRVLDITPTSEPSRNVMSMRDAQDGPGTWWMRDDLPPPRIADGSFAFHAVPVFTSNEIFDSKVQNYSCRLRSQDGMLCRVVSRDWSDPWYVALDRLARGVPLAVARDEPAAGRLEMMTAAPRRGPWANPAAAFRTAKPLGLRDLTGRWSRVMDTRGPGGGGPAWMEMRVLGKSILLFMRDAWGQDIGFRGTKDAALVHGALSFVAAPVFKEMEWEHSCKRLAPARLLCRVSSKFVQAPWFVGFERNGAGSPTPAPAAR